MSLSTFKSEEKPVVDTKPAVKPVPRIKSSDLMQRLRELEIDHEGRIYRLRITQLNKLILTAWVNCLDKH